jgi:hypothetical protein
VAGVLGQPVSEVCSAVSLASRLGFATRIDPPPPRPRSSNLITSEGGGGGVAQVGLLLREAEEGGEGGGGVTGDDAARSSSLAALLMRDSESGAGAEAATAARAAQDTRAVAVVLDAEATSFLMMGALSPGTCVPVWCFTCSSFRFNRESGSHNTVIRSGCCGRREGALHSHTTQIWYVC